MASIGNGNANFTKSQKIELLKQKNPDLNTVSKSAVNNADTSLFTGTTKASFGVLTGGNSLKTGLSQQNGNFFANPTTKTSTGNDKTSIFGSNPQVKPNNSEDLLNSLSDNTLDQLLAENYQNDLGMSFSSASGSSSSSNIKSAGDYSVSLGGINASTLNSLGKNKASAAKGRAIAKDAKNASNATGMVEDTVDSQKDAEKMNNSQHNGDVKNAQNTSKTTENSANAQARSQNKQADKNVAKPKKTADTPKVQNKSIGTNNNVSAGSTGKPASVITSSATPSVAGNASSVAINNNSTVSLNSVAPKVDNNSVSSQKQEAMSFLTGNKNASQKAAATTSFDNLINAQQGNAQAAEKTASNNQRMSGYTQTIDEIDTNIGNNQDEMKVSSTLIQNHLNASNQYKTAAQSETQQADAATEKAGVAGALAEKFSARSVTEFTLSKVSTVAAKTAYDAGKALATGAEVDLAKGVKAEIQSIKSMVEGVKEKAIGVGKILSGEVSITTGIAQIAEGTVAEAAGTAAQTLGNSITFAGDLVTVAGEGLTACAGIPIIGPILAAAGNAMISGGGALSKSGLNLTTTGAKMQATGKLSISDGQKNEANGTKEVADGNNHVAKSAQKETESKTKAAEATKAKADAAQKQTAAAAKERLGNLAIKKADELAEKAVVSAAQKGAQEATKAMFDEEAEEHTQVASTNNKLSAEQIAALNQEAQRMNAITMNMLGLNQEKQNVLTAMNKDNAQNLIAAENIEARDVEIKTAASELLDAIKNDEQIKENRLQAEQAADVEEQKVAGNKEADKGGNAANETANNAANSVANQAQQASGANDDKKASETNKTAEKAASKNDKLAKKEDKKDNKKVDDNNAKTEKSENESDAKEANNQSSNGEHQQQNNNGQNSTAPKEEKASVDTNVGNNSSKLKLFTM